MKKVFYAGLIGCFLMGMFSGVSLGAEKVLMMATTTRSAAAVLSSWEPQEISFLPGWGTSPTSSCSCRWSQVLGGGPSASAAGPSKCELRIRPAEQDDAARVGQILASGFDLPEEASTLAARRAPGLPAGVHRNRDARRRRTQLFVPELAARWFRRAARA